MTSIAGRGRGGARGYAAACGGNVWLRHCVRSYGFAALRRLRGMVMAGCR